MGEIRIIGGFMKNFSKYAMFAVSFACATPAFAQRVVTNPVIPEPGDMIVNVLQRSNIPNTSFYTQPDKFNFPNLSINLESYDPAFLLTRYPALDFRPAQPNSSDPVLISAANVMGVALNINASAETSTNGARSVSFDIRIPCLSTLSAGPIPIGLDGVPVPGGLPTTGSGDQFNATYGYIETNYATTANVRILGSDYAQAYANYRAFLDGQTVPTVPFPNSPTTGAEYRAGIYACSVARGNQNPIVGSADSQQFQIVTDGLDLANSDGKALNESGNFDDSGFGVGLWGGPVRQNGRNGVDISGRVNKSWRIFKGSRSLLAVDVPMTYRRLGGQEAYKASLAVSVVHAVNPRWILEPRVAYGYTDAPDDGLKGQVAAFTLGSRYALKRIGRGMLTVGNMVGYSKVVDVKFMGQGVKDGNTSNWTVLNGLAYDLPLKARTGGRNLSLRASYMFSHMFGDELYTRDVHLVSASLGFRLRENATRHRTDLIRLGFNGKFARNYKAVYAVAGYQF